MSIGPDMAGKKKILIIDDDHDIKTLIRKLLEQDYELMFTSDGAEGLHLAKKHSPDLIILDIMLPKMDGFMICRMLKFDSKYAGIPIVMLTGKAGDSDKAKGLEAGAQAYIVKPFSKDELLKAVTGLIR